jgi:hypothetical protein
MRKQLQNEKVPSMGIFEIEVRNTKTGKIKRFDIKNRVTDDFLNRLVGVTAGEDPDLEFKYLAVGTDNTAVSDTSTQLGSEVFRTQESSASIQTAVGTRSIEFTLLKAEANVQIEEIGIFAGTTATSAPNSGILVSRILWSYLKTSDEEIVIKRVDVMGRA